MPIAVTTILVLLAFGSVVAFLAFRAVFREGRPTNFKVQGLPPMWQPDHDDSDPSNDVQD
ncbi:MAG TPA: hypothetical protein VHO29_05495 [Marmoricola sp.]|nr:hypothetical protein [Marmoricola sp.]